MFKKSIRGEFEFWKGSYQASNNPQVKWFLKREREKNEGKGGGMGEDGLLFWVEVLPEQKIE